MQELLKFSLRKNLNCRNNLRKYIRKTNLQYFQAGLLLVFGAIIEYKNSTFCSTGPAGKLKYRNANKTLIQMSALIWNNIKFNSFKSKDFLKIIYSWVQQQQQQQQQLNGYYCPSVTGSNLDTCLNDMPKTYNINYLCLLYNDSFKMQSPTLKGQLHKTILEYIWFGLNCFTFLYIVLI